MPTSCSQIPWFVWTRFSVFVRLDCSFLDGHEFRRHEGFPFDKRGVERLAWLHARARLCPGESAQHVSRTACGGRDAWRVQRPDPGPPCAWFKCFLGWILGGSRCRSGPNGQPRQPDDGVQAEGRWCFIKTDLSRFPCSSDLGERRFRHGTNALGVRL